MREHQRRQPAGIQLAAGVAGVRRSRRPGRRRLRRQPARSVGRRSWLQAADEQRRLERELLHKTEGRESIAGIREEMQHIMEGSAGIYRSAPCLVRGRRQATATARTLPPPSPCRTTAELSTPNWPPPWNCRTCWTWPRPSFSPPCAARSRAAPISAATFPPATINAISPIRWPSAMRMARAASIIVPVTITRWPPGERVYGK